MYTVVSSGLLILKIIFLYLIKGERINSVPAVIAGCLAPSVKIGIIAGTVCLIVSIVTVILAVVTVLDYHKVSMRNRPAGIYIAPYGLGI